jgi:heme exporter protein A
MPPTEAAAGATGASGGAAAGATGASGGAAAGATGASGGAAVGPAIELRDLGRAYGERVALSGVTLSLPAGSTLAVFGANGAGKTTLLRILATLLRPHRGEARVLGRALPGEGWAVRGRVGLLGHDPLLYRDLTARENLRFHARLHGLAAGAGRASRADRTGRAGRAGRAARAGRVRGPGAERIEALLDAVGMTRRADEPVHTLSRGMAQRVAVCRAVLHEPELLLLDEPLANLDPGAAAAVGPLIGPASGFTRVVISHDVAHGLAEADLVLGLRGGRQALLAPRSEVAEAAVRELYA